MKHLNANLDNTTNIEVPLEETLRILGLDADNNIVEITGLSLGDTGGGGGGGQGGDNTDGDGGDGGPDGMLEPDLCVDLLIGSGIRFRDSAAANVPDLAWLQENFGTAAGEFYDCIIDASDNGLSTLRDIIPATVADNTFVSVAAGTISFTGLIPGGTDFFQFRYYSASIDRTTNLITLGGMLTTQTAGTLGSVITDTTYDLGNAQVWGPVRTGINSINLPSAMPLPLIGVNNFAWSRSTTFNLGALLRTPASYIAENFVTGTFSGFQFGGFGGENAPDFPAQFQAAIQAWSGNGGFTISTSDQPIPTASGFQLACRVTSGSNTVTFVVSNVRTGSNYLDRGLFFTGENGNEFTTEDFIEGSGSFTAAASIATVVSFFPYTPGTGSGRDPIVWVDGNSLWEGDSGTYTVCGDGLGGGEVTIDGDIVGMEIDCEDIRNSDADITITYNGIATSQPTVLATPFTTDSWTTDSFALQEANQDNPGTLPGILSLNREFHRRRNPNPISTAQQAANLVVTNDIVRRLGQNDFELDGNTGAVSTTTNTLTTFTIDSVDASGRVTATVTLGDIGLSDGSQIEDPVERQRFYVGSFKYIISNVTGAGTAWSFDTTPVASGSNAPALNTVSGLTDTYTLTDDIVFQRSIHFGQGIREFSVGTVTYQAYNPGFTLDFRFLQLNYAPDVDTALERNAITGGVGSGSQGVVLLNRTRLTAVDSSMPIEAMGNLMLTIDGVVDAQYIVGTRVNITVNGGTTFQATIDSITAGTGDINEWVLTDLSITSDIATVTSVDSISCVNTNEDVDVGGGGDIIIDGDTEIDGDLDVDGDILNDGDSIVVGDLGVGGDSTVEGDSDTGGDSTTGGDSMTMGDSTTGGDQKVDGSICQGGDSFDETAGVFSTAVSAGVSYQGEVVSSVLISAVLNDYRLYTTLSVGDYMIFQNTDPTDTTDNAALTSGTYEITSKTDGTPNILGISRVSGNFKFNQATATITTYTGGTCTVGGDETVDGDLLVDGDGLFTGDLIAERNLCQGGDMFTVFESGDEVFSDAILVSIGSINNVIQSIVYNNSVVAAAVNEGDLIALQDFADPDITGTYEVATINGNNIDLLRMSGTFVGVPDPDDTDLSGGLSPTTTLLGYYGGTCAIGGDVVADGDLVVDGDGMLMGDLTVEGVTCSGGTAGSHALVAGDLSTGAGSSISFNNLQINFVSVAGSELGRIVNLVRNGNIVTTTNQVNANDEFTIYNSDGSRSGVYFVENQATAVGGYQFVYRSGDLSPADIATGELITIAYMAVCMSDGGVDAFDLNAAVATCTAATGQGYAISTTARANNADGAVDTFTADATTSGLFWIALNARNSRDPVAGDRIFIYDSINATGGLYEVSTVTGTTPFVDFIISFQRLTGNWDFVGGNRQPTVFTGGSCIVTEDMVMEGTIAPRMGIARAVTRDATAGTSDTGGTNFWSGTRAQYDAITTKDPNVIYNIR